MTATGGPRLALRALVLAGVVLSGFCLRPAVTSVGALLPELRRSLPLTGLTAGVLTALPAVCFAGLGLLAPRLARRIGPEIVMTGALLLIAAGVGARALSTGPAGFLSASVVALAGIATANVLGAPLVRRHFPRRSGVVTGLYATSITAGVALPAAVSAPMAELGGAADGWRVGLGIWAPVAALAALPWLVAARGPWDSGPVERPSARPGCGPSPGTVVALTAFFGLQSLAAFVIMGWLPAVFVDAGLPGSAAGLLLAATAALAAPLALLVPVLAERARARPWLVLGVAVMSAAGWTGMLFDPAGAPWLWAALLTSAHCTYPLALALIRLHSTDDAAESRLSATVQTGGYLLAAIGPLLTGLLRESTAGWTVPIAAVLGVLVLQAAAGLAGLRIRTADDYPAT